MKINRAFKTQLLPNNNQSGLFNQYAGTARFVYNWALADRIEKYEAGNPTNMYEQKRRFNSVKREEFPWIYDYAYVIQEEAFRHLDRAYKDYFDICSGKRPKPPKPKKPRRDGKSPGFPKFKNRFERKSFTMRKNIHIEEKRIKLPRIGWVRLAERNYLPTNGVKLLSVNISEAAGKWYASVQVETDIPDPERKNGNPLGVDVGIKSLAVCSDGKTFDNPKALYKAERKLRRLNRELSRRKKGGKNRQKTKIKLSKAHRKVRNIRRHALNNISRYAVDVEPSTIVIESLNVKGMMKNRCLSKSLGDASMAELHRQIEYKSEWCGIDVMKADRFYPSSKTCSRCGNVKDDLDLGDRVYVCLECGNEIDRDLNAALNLAALVEGETHPDSLFELTCSNALR